MSTIEKLIGHIFERKRSIIEQVRHQVELYDQQLASKLVIQGIDPPSWLWNHEAPSQSSDPSEIDKQRLISELLLPLPEQTFPCFDDVRYVPDISKEVEPAASSPQNQVVTRLHDGNSEVNLSHPDFKRSKSRQRALEQRSSSKNGSKYCVQDANISAISYKNSTPFMHDSVRCNLVEKPDSDRHLNIQHDDQDMVAKSCTEDKASEELDYVLDSIDHDCRKTKTVKVQSQMLSQDLLDIRHEVDAESEDMKKQSCNENKSSGSMTMLHFHGDSVDRTSKSLCNESRGKVSKLTQSPNILFIRCDGDVESKGIDAQCRKGNNTSDSACSQQFGHVCGSVEHICEIKSVGDVFSEANDKTTEFPGIFNIQLGRFESECPKDNNTSEVISSQRLNNEFDSTKLDISCTDKTMVAVSSGGMEDIIIEKMERGNPSAVAFKNHCTDPAINPHYLHNNGSGLPLPSSIIKSENSLHKPSDAVPTFDAANRDIETGSAFSFDSLHENAHASEFPDLVRTLRVSHNFSGMMEELTESPANAESSSHINIDFNSHFVTAEHGGEISMASSSSEPLRNVGHVLESCQSFSPSAIIISNDKGSKDCYRSTTVSENPGVKYLELHSLSCGLEGGGSPHEQSKAAVPHLEIGTVEESCLRKEETTSSPLSNGDVHNHAYEFRAQSASCHVTSQVLEDSFNIQAAVPHLERGTVEQSCLQKEETTSSPLSNGDVQNHAYEFRAQSASCHVTSPVLEDSFNIQEAMPHLERGTVEQSYLQKEETTSSPLSNRDVHNHAYEFRAQSASCHVTSKVFEDSFNIQDYIGIQEDSKNGAAEFTLNAKTEDSLRYSSVEAKETTDNNLMIGNRAECFFEGSPSFLDTDAKVNVDNNEHEKLSNRGALEKESYAAGFEKDKFFDAKYIDMMDTDQTMPALEGFIMDSDDGVSNIAGSEVGFEESILPSSPIKRASILERLCQSYSRNTPVSSFPATYRLHKQSDLYRSVPNGLLEHIPLIGDYSNKRFQQKFHSASLPFSADPSSLSVSTPYASPFKKQWDCSKSSSGLKGVSNPELVCFTIEEDPGNCDEIGNHDEIVEAPVSHAACLRNSLKRKPLSDITVDGQNLPSVSANNEHVLRANQTPTFHFKSVMDSAGTEANLTKAQMKDQQTLGKKFSNKKRRLNDTKENKNPSMDTNGGKRGIDTLKETKSKKPKFSENLSTTAGVSDQQTVVRSNNIVSNISSFIPLVQQKKAAAVAAGKRDVKVKALQAAEAAKRLEEKKENERKMKKEAWKAEKARLEQENLLQLELKKKKKEEELKKKEVEIAARKRIREEEEKKEKDGKRRRVEEARKQQREQERKQTDKLEKETRHQAAGLRMHEKKDPKSGLEQCMEMDGIKSRVTRKSEETSRIVLCDPRQSDSKVINPLVNASTTVCGNSNLNMSSQVQPKCQHSYAISPYQGSDDEDEDDDKDRRKDKFIPDWASKNNLAEAIFLQENIVPDKIFPIESFCSIAEVLIPRKLQTR